VTREIQIQCIQLIREGFPHLIASKMVLVHKDVQILALEDIQKLKATCKYCHIVLKGTNEGFRTISG